MHSSDFVGNIHRRKSIGDSVLYLKNICYILEYEFTSKHRVLKILSQSFKKPKLRIT
jgi:hypothetical protein